jgi:UDP:flavonoid glycosyltransferase YjiC (YdhE family)
MLGASIPLEFTPPNVTSAGPIILNDEPAIEQDPELTAWLARAPTVLVNLGSLFTYTEEQATTMAQAIADLLARSDVQVLWKLAKESTYTDTRYKMSVRSDIKKGRLRTTDWLSVSPSALLGTGHIVASVHHGGANCYYESVSYVLIPPR